MNLDCDQTKITYGKFDLLHQIEYETSARKNLLPLFPKSNLLLNKRNADSKQQKQTTNNHL